METLVIEVALDKAPGFIPPRGHLAFEPGRQGLLLTSPRTDSEVVDFQEVTDEACLNQPSLYKLPKSHHAASCLCP